MFGQRSLSHPLIVEAIEELYTPVLVYNNKKGSDAAMLERFGEPSWNNPVIRYLDADADDLIPREDGVWTLAGTASRMVAALEEAGRPVPSYLRLLRDELRAGDLSTAVFAMHCFWVGEGKLGRLDGVVTTRPVWIDGREGVEVVYDRERVALPALVQAAEEARCADRVYVPSARLDTARDAASSEVRELSTRPKAAKASDDKHALRRSPLRFLPMTDAQATKVNAALHQGEEWRTSLSPRQVELAETLLRRLGDEPKLLDGLSRPSDPLKLVDYADEVRARVGR